MAYGGLRQLVGWSWSLRYRGQVEMALRHRSCLRNSVYHSKFGKCSEHRSCGSFPDTSYKATEDSPWPCHLLRHPSTANHSSLHHSVQQILHCSDWRVRSFIWQKLAHDCHHVYVATGILPSQLLLCWYVTCRPISSNLAPFTSTAMLKLKQQWQSFIASANIAPVFPISSLHPRQTLPPLASCVYSLCLSL